MYARKNPHFLFARFDIHLADQRNVQTMQSETETKGPSILLAYPCYGSKVYVQFHESLLLLTHLLETKKIGWSLYSIPFDSLIPRARNACVARFLESSHTHLMFLDTDIVFQPKDVLRLLEHDKPIIAGVYPKKGVELEKLTPIWSRGDCTKESVFSRASDYVVELDPMYPELKDNLLRVRYVGTGFLMIRRDAIQQLCEAYPERRFDMDGIFTPQCKGDVFYDLFGVGVMQDKRLYQNKRCYLSEDWMFCRLAELIDLPVYVDVTIPLMHMGTFVYQGHYSQHLLERYPGVHQVESTEKTTQSETDGGNSSSGGLNGAFS